MIPTFAQTSLYTAVLGLFASGTQGAFLDANDWANTCFQDAAGTTPVTGMEQPVGLIKDKSGRGNNATSSGANRPVISARYNLLTATDTLSTQSVTTVATNYVLYFTGSGTVTLSGTATGTKSAGSNTITCTAGTLTLTVTGSVLTADLRPSDQATGLIPTYQRVNTATDYDWSPAFPPMIRGNGSNQYLTGNLDLSGTNKVTVWASARKFVDVTTGIIFELSNNAATNNGALYLAFNASGNNTVFLSRGTAYDGPSISMAAAPATVVLSGQGDISAPSAKIRSNGVLSQTSGSQGTGNYGNYPYYLLSRGGASLFMSGGFNSLIILGAAATAAQISTTEAWANSKVRAY